MHETFQMNLTLEIFLKWGGGVCSTKQKAMRILESKSVTNDYSVINCMLSFITHELFQIVSIST